MSALKDLQEKRNGLAAKMREIGSRQKEWKPEDETAWRQVNADYKATMDAIGAEKAKEDRDAEIRAALEGVERDDKESQNRHDLGREDTDRGDRRNGKRNKKDDSAETRALVFQSWLRANNRLGLRKNHKEACRRAKFDPRSNVFILKTGSRIDRRAEAWASFGGMQIRAALNITDATQGKETIPAGFMYELDRKMLAFGGPRNVCRVIQTASGNSMPWPTLNDTGNTGELLAEATDVGSSVAPATAAVTFGAFKFSSKAVLISAELLEDSAFDMEAEIGSILGERLGRVTGAYTTTGTGSGQPQGIVTGSALGVTAQSATAISADEVIKLVHSLDPSYRALSSVGFMMHDNILLYVRLLKDANGAYLWQQGLAAGAPDKLCGYPIAINQHMQSSVATNTKTMLFGAFEKFVIRDVGQHRFKKLSERYAELDQVGFFDFIRLDSKVLQSAAIKHLLQA